MGTLSPSYYRKVIAGTQLSAPPQLLQRPDGAGVSMSQAQTEVHVGATRIPDRYWKLPSDTLTYVNGVPLRQTETDGVFPSDSPSTEAERLWLYNLSAGIVENIANQASHLNLHSMGDVRFILHSLHVLQALSFELSRHLAYITVDKRTYPYLLFSKLLASIADAIQGLIDNLVCYAAPEDKVEPLLQNLSDFHLYTGQNIATTGLYTHIQDTKIIDTETSMALITDLEHRLDDAKKEAKKREAELITQIKALENELAIQKRSFARLELELSATKTLRSTICSTQVAQSSGPPTMPASSTSGAMGAPGPGQQEAGQKQQAREQATSINTELITTNIYSSFTSGPTNRIHSPVKLPTQNLHEVYSNIRAISAQRSRASDEGGILSQLGEMPLSYNSAGQQTLGADEDYLVLRTHTSGSQCLIDRAKKKSIEQNYVETVPTSLEITSYYGETEIDFQGELRGTPQRSSVLFQTVGTLLSTQGKGGSNRILSRPKTAPEPDYSMQYYKETQEIGPTESTSIELTTLHLDNQTSSGVRDTKSAVQNHAQNSLDLSFTLRNAAARSLGHLTTLDEDDGWRLEANLCRQMTRDLPSTLSEMESKASTRFILQQQPSDNYIFSLLNPICTSHDRAIGELDMNTELFRIAFQPYGTGPSYGSNLSTRGYSSQWTNHYLQQYMPRFELAPAKNISSRPLLLSNHTARSSSLPEAFLSPKHANSLNQEDQPSTSPLKSTDGRHIPVLTKSSRMSIELRPKSSLKVLSTLKSARPKPPKRASSNFSLGKPHTESPLVEEEDTFSKLIAYGEEDITTKITDPSALSIKCRTIYSKTRAELHTLYEKAVFLHGSSMLADDFVQEHKILLQPRYITRHTSIIDALLGTSDGLQVIPFIRSPAYLEIHYGQSSQKKEALMNATQKLFCSDSIFSFTSNENIFATLNERLSIVSQQESRQALWCDFITQWKLVSGISGPPDSEAKRLMSISAALEGLCNKWSIDSIIKMLLCYKFDLHTIIRLSDLYPTKGTQQDGHLSPIQMLINPGAFAGTNKQYFLGLSKNTQLYKILKPAIKAFCNKLESVTMRGSGSGSLKSNKQMKINVEESRGLLHLQAVLSGTGYTLLDLRTVLGIIHEIFIQRYASFEIVLQGGANYVPLDKFLMETFMKENAMDVEKACRALISFLFSIQAYILCDHLSDDESLRDPDYDDTPIDDTGSGGLSPREVEGEVSLLDNPSPELKSNKPSPVAEKGVQYNEFLIVFLELISSQDHLSVEYTCYSYICFYNSVGSRYPYPYVSLDSVLILSRRLLAELPKPYFQMLSKTFKKMAVEAKYNSPVLDIGTVLRVLGSQKRMIRFMLVNSFCEEYGRILYKRSSSSVQSTNEQICGLQVTGGLEFFEPPSTASGKRSHDGATRSKTASKQKRDSKVIKEFKTSTFMDIPITYDNFLSVLSAVGCTLSPAMYTKVYFDAMWIVPSITPESAVQTDLALPSLRHIFKVMPYTAHAFFPHLFSALARKDRLLSVQRLYYNQDFTSQRDLHALLSRYTLCSDKQVHLRELRTTLKTIVYELEAPLKRLVSMLTCEAHGLSYNMEPFYLTCNLADTTDVARPAVSRSSNRAAEFMPYSIMYTMPMRRNLSTCALHITTLYFSVKLTIANDSLPEESLIEVIGMIRTLTLHMHQAYQSLRPFNCNINGLLYELEDRLQGVERCDSYLCKNVTTEEMLRETLGVDNINGPLARVLGMARNSIYVH